MSVFSAKTLAYLTNLGQESQSNPDEYFSNPFATLSSDANPQSVATIQDSKLVCDSRLGSGSYSDSDSVDCLVTDLFENRSSQQFDDFSDASSFINPFSEVDFEGHDGNSVLGFGGVGPNLRDSNLDVVRFTGLDSGLDSVLGGPCELVRDGWFDDSDIGLCLDNLVLENQRTMHDYLDLGELIEREDVSVVIGEFEELSVASGFSYGDDETGEETWRYLEWESLLEINNLGQEVNLVSDAVSSAVDVQNASETFFYYGLIFEASGEFMANIDLPASKVAVENLPSVVLTMEDLLNISSCAICKNEVVVKEKLTRLPCLHYFHGECIIPWLRIRNTCPLCRSELPTDDHDYERRRAER